VLPAFAVVVFVGGLFWATVWAVLRTPSRPATSTAPEMVVEAVPEAIDDENVGERQGIGEHESSDDANAVAYDEADEAATDEVAADESTVSPMYEGTTVASDGSPTVAIDVAAIDAMGDPRFGPYSADGPGIASEPSEAAQLDQVALGPLYGPFLADIVDGEPGAQGAVASGDAADELVANAGEQAASRAEEIAARAEDLATRAEELTARIEGLTARIEELQTKLEATGGALVARPAVVASPVPGPRTNETVVARAGQGQGPGTTGATTVRTSNQQTTSQQATSGTGARAPWVVLPQPEPGSKVTAGPLVLEARARGEAPITQIRLVLDGVALPVALERRDDTTWRGRASTRVTPGSHTVAVAVVDGQGRTGSYRWQFDAGS
jgi:hypothetical protein